MSVIISNQATTIEFLFSTGERTILDKDNLNLKESGTIIRKYVNISNSPGFIQTAENDVVKIHWSDVTSPAVASNQELIDAILAYKAMTGVTLGDVRVIGDNGNVLDIEANGSMPVTLQDPTTDIVIAPITILEQSTTTSAPVAIGDYTVTLTSVTGVSDSKFLAFFNPTAVRFMTARVLGTPVGNVVTIDTPFDFAYPAGSFVDVGESNLAQNGSVTPIIAGLRNNAGAVPPPGLDLAMDVTRIMFQFITSSPPTITDFGDISGGITRGLVLRRRDGTYNNIFNFKTNGGLMALAYDVDFYAGGGQDGLGSRLTFAGQDKMGAAVRIDIDEDIEIIIQDDLTNIVELRILAEGSLVQD